MVRSAMGGIKHTRVPRAVGALLIWTCVIWTSPWGLNSTSWHHKKPTTYKTSNLTLLERLVLEKQNSVVPHQQALLQKAHFLTCLLTSYATPLFFPSCTTVHCSHNLNLPLSYLYHKKENLMISLAHLGNFSVLHSNLLQNCIDNLS
jgi:hypothetical protein